jgi:hypothetical protein
VAANRETEILQETLVKKNPPNARVTEVLVEVLCKVPPNLGSSYCYIIA